MLLRYQVGSDTRVEWSFEPRAVRSKARAKRTRRGDHCRGPGALGPIFLRLFDEGSHFDREFATIAFGRGAANTGTIASTRLGGLDAFDTAGHTAAIQSLLVISFSIRLGNGGRIEKGRTADVGKGAKIGGLRASTGHAFSPKQGRNPAGKFIGIHDICLHAATAAVKIVRKIGGRCVWMTHGTESTSLKFRPEMEA